MQRSMSSTNGAPSNADSPSNSGTVPDGRPSRYESQKRRDWNTFGQYLRNHRPPLELSRCSGAHVLEFLRYLDQFGKTKVHTIGCPFYGHPHPPAPCPCPLRQAWGSLDALVGRLRAAFEENGGQPEANPFGARAVRLYLREIRDSQAKARGISYEKKKRRKPLQSAAMMPAVDATHLQGGTGLNSDNGNHLLLHEHMTVTRGGGDDDLMMVTDSQTVLSGKPDAGNTSSISHLRSFKYFSPGNTKSGLDLLKIKEQKQSSLKHKV